MKVDYHQGREFRVAHMPPPTQDRDAFCRVLPCPVNMSQINAEREREKEMERKRWNKDKGCGEKRGRLGE